MGVPAFFRWLSRKYPSIITNCVEQKSEPIDGVEVPVDATEPNPNGYEFDNLYLDMNGIIHPCSHPESGPAPKNEGEMMLAIFAYIDRLFSIVRPRRVLYMAIDGVAPRAKMNQQRSRRFRAAREGEDKRQEIDQVRAELSAQGIPLPPPKAEEDHFDSNCITPGTPFMARLAVCLRYYVHQRLNSDPAWAKIQVILSDANAPGEGEHKIMDYIRRQRASPSHDPNTHHCLCGADADLIMLGLATHEPNFTIIREEFIPHTQKPCELCAQYGHELKNCQGLAKEKSGEYGEVADVNKRDKNFIFVRIPILREYLERELAMPNLPFPYDFERAVDDWVFMCFFVGNDFLPHLPSLEIREGAIDRLIKLYKNTVYKTGGYLTSNGIVNLSRVQLILSELGGVEDEIFKMRQHNEINFRRRNKQKKFRERVSQTAPAWIPQNGAFAPTRPGRDVVAPAHGARQTAFEMRRQQAENSKAARDLRSMLHPSGGSAEGNSRKRQHITIDDISSESEPEDEVKLFEDGWKERYYQSKFEVSTDETTFRYKVAEAYVEGLCWVLRYYYQGCPSWKWFFPYHYAPFASDFVNIGDLSFPFDPTTKPFAPLEQLMGVFPAASRQHLPEAWQHMMTELESPIIDFYPENFKIDLNGKKYAWQGVALLPFVEEGRLLRTLNSVYPQLNDDERERNIKGSDRLFVCKDHPSFAFVAALYENGDVLSEWCDVDPSTLDGVSGFIQPDSTAVLVGDTFEPPSLLRGSCAPLTDNRTLCVQWKDPEFESDKIFPSKRLDGAKTPPRTLKPGNWDDQTQGRYRPQIGFTRDAVPHASMSQAGHRMLKAGIGQYSEMAPPDDSSYRRGGGGGGYRGGGYRGASAGGPHGRSRTADDRYDNSYGGGGRGGGYRHQPYSARSIAPPMQQYSGGRGGEQWGGGGGAGSSYRQRQQGGSYAGMEPYGGGQHGGSQWQQPQQWQAAPQPLLRPPQPRHQGGSSYPGYQRPSASDYF